MGKILTGFDFTAARSKREVDEDAPTQESMRGSRTLMSNPSTDQKKIRRELGRKTASRKLADVLEQAHEFAKSKGLTDEEAARFAQDLGDVWAEDGLDTPPEVMDSLVRSYHKGSISGGDLWDSAEAAYLGPVVAWNPFKKKEDSSDSSKCSVCGKEKKWDAGDESMSCPDFYKHSSKTAVSIDQIRSIRDDFKTEKIDGMLVDPTTANAILTVHDALSPETQEKFAGLPLLKMVDTAWKLVKPASLAHVDFREAAEALDEVERAPLHVAWNHIALEDERWILQRRSDDGSWVNQTTFSNKSDADKAESTYGDDYRVVPVAQATGGSKTAFMTDFAHVRSDADALNGYGVAMTYNGDSGMHTVVGELSYDGKNCTVTNNFGRIVSVPVSQVLGLDETTSDQYNRRPMDIAEISPDGSDNFNPLQTLFSRIPLSATSDLETEGHIDEDKPVPDYPHALEDMRQHLLNHTDLDNHPLPEKKSSLDTLMEIIAENEAY